MVPEKKHKKSKSKEKDKKKQQDKKHYSSISEDELFEDGSETDDVANMEEDLHSIGYYVGDRKAMLDHVFSVTTERKIRAMLPPVLKGLPLSELKSMCLDQLLGMSTKRILSVLEGQQLDSSSDTDDAGNDSDSDPKGQGGDEKNQGDGIADIDGIELSGPDLDTLEIGITSKEIGDLFTDDAEPKTEKNKEEKASDKKSKRLPKKKHKKRSEDKKKRDKECKVVTETGKVNKPAQLKENTEEEKGKSLLEILELEMRARAIRALLREHGDSPVRDLQGPAVQLPCQRRAGSAKQEDEPPDKEEMDVRCPRKVRRLKGRFQAPVVKTEVIDVDSDSSLGDVKEIIRGIHSDLETVSSGEEVFMDMKKTYDAAREDGEISSLDDDVIEVEPDVQREAVIVVDDSDGEDGRGDCVRSLPDVAATPGGTGDSAEPSWAQRWLKSKGVQKVVTDSRMFARIHKRLRTARRSQGACPPERQRTDTKPSIEVVGSVDEYKSLQLK